MPTFTAADLGALRDIAEAAGQAVMEAYASGGEVWQKEDATPLTLADLQSDAIIAAGLARAFPGVAVVSEESDIAAPAGCTLFFLVDPLDGTREFLGRNGEFTVNIALVDQGAAIAGVVVAPALGETFFAAQGVGAWKSCAGATMPIRARASRGIGAPLRVVGSRSHGIDRLEAWLATLPVAHVFTPVGSSLKFCRVAEGWADIYPRLGPTSQWDTAAAQCVLELAGGQVLDFAGHALRYGVDRSIRNPEFLAIGSGISDDVLQSMLGRAAR